MGEVSSPPGVPALVFQALVDAHDALAAAVDNRINAILDKIAASAFVSNSAMTLSSLLSTYPASVDNVGKYARVTDLYGSVDEVMRSRWDGVAYRWVPQRESFTGTTAAASGLVTIIPLVTPPTLRMTATLTGNVNVTAATTNAYIGQRQRVITPSTIPALLSISLTGLIGSSLPLLAGSYRDIEYGPTGWFAA